MFVADPMEHLRAELTFHQQDRCTNTASVSQVKAE